MDYATRRRVVMDSLHEYFYACLDSLTGPLPLAGKVNDAVFSNGYQARGSLREALAFAAKHFAGVTVINENDGTAIIISKGGLDHALRSRAGPVSAAVATDLVTFLTKARFYEEVEVNAKDKNSSVRRIFVYAGKFDLGDRLINVGALIKEYKDGTRYYHHFILKNQDI